MGRDVLVIDLETFSPVDLLTQGAAAYAEHPETRIICAAFGLLAPDNDLPHKTHLWWAGEELPEWVAEALMTLRWVAHNAAFERLVLHNQPPAEWPDLPYGDPVLWHCTQAMCGYRALPLALEEVAIALGQAEKKDPAGKRLIRRCCKPQKRPPTVEELERLGAYCVQDVMAECQLAHAIGWELPAAEREVWLVDQFANDRGLPLDIKLARAIDGIADAIDAASSKRLEELTGGAVTSLTQNKKLAEWAGLPSVSKTAIAQAEGLSPEVAEALTLRPRTSLRKARKALGAACRDGRVRHTQQYHAATTGRWGGRLVQPHNFARPVTKSVDFDTLVALPPTLLASIFGWKWVEEQAVSALRGMIASGPDDPPLTRADLSAIEARVVLWLAGEWDAIEKYRAGVDLYCDFASVLHGRTITKGDPERAHGKIGILGCGFQAGDKRLYQQAVDDGVPGITRELIKTLVDTYRTRYSRVPKLWRNLNDAALASIGAGGEWVEVRDVSAPVAFRVAKGPAGHVWMQCRLPSGRLLHYFDPIIATNKFGRPCVQWRAMKPGKSGGRVWTVVSGYGGFFTENVVQAIARDIIAGAFVRLEKMGHRPIFLVHDEVVCESGLPAEELEAILSMPVDFAPGLPIAAEGARERRFGK